MYNRYFVKIVFTIILIAIFIPRVAQWGFIFFIVTLIIVLFFKYFIINSTYLAVLFNKGAKGEHRISRILKNLGSDYYVLQNLYIPKPDGTTTEIDVLLIHKTGIYVIESKDYQGRIIGDCDSKIWTQSFKSGKKYNFYNPIVQNANHIIHLKNYLIEQGVNSSYFSLIVFGNNCSLVVKNKQMVNAEIMKVRKMKKAVKKSTKNSAINSIDPVKVFEILLVLSNQSISVKRKHIKRVRK